MVKRYTASRMAALALALVLPACAPGPAEDAAASGASRPVVAASPGTSLGAFLAGRFAQVHGDTQAASAFYTAAARRDPDNIDLLQRAFTLTVAEGRLEEAVPLAEKLLSFDADAVMPSLVMGVRDAQAGRFAAAEQRFAVLPPKGISTMLGPLLTAWSRLGQSRIDAALEALSPMSATTGLAPLYELHAGLISDLADRPTDAEQHYRTVLAGSVNLRAIQAAGAFFQRRGQPDKAREIYDRYTSDHPERMLFDGTPVLALGASLSRPVGTPGAGMAEALFDAASLMRQGNAYEMAMVLARLTLVLEPNTPLAQILLAEILGAQGRLAEANQLYRAIDPAVPASALARLKLAINLDELGDTDGALKELKALATASPASLDPLVTMGDVLRRRKRFDEAVDAYGRAVDQVGATTEARFWSLFYARGIALERAGRWTQAEGAFLKALELKADQPDVLNYLGYTWVDQGHNLEAGRKMIEKAVELRPNDGAIVDSLGWALYRMGEYVGAVKQLERAVEIKPEDPTINDHLGDALWQVGRLAEARFQWQRAMILEPEADQLTAIKAKLQSGMPPAKPLAAH